MVKIADSLLGVVVVVALVVVVVVLVLIYGHDLFDLQEPPPPVPAMYYKPKV